MRDAFHDDLDSINQTLVEMSTLVAGAMGRATTALLQPNLELAEEVIADDDRVDAIQHELDNKTLEVMARQQPVASDLRNLVTSLRMSADFERMGDFAHHVARIARSRAQYRKLFDSNGLTALGSHCYLSPSCDSPVSALERL